MLKAQFNRMTPMLLLGLMVYLILAGIIILIFYGWVVPEIITTYRKQDVSLNLVLFELFWLFFVWLLMLILTSRLIAATCLSLVLYGCFLVVNLIKIEFLAAPLMPVDFTQLDDLLRTTSVMLEYLPYILVVVGLLGLLIYFTFTKEKPLPRLRLTGVVVCLLLSAVMYGQSNNIRTTLSKEKLLIVKNTNLVVRFVRNGFLNFFMQAIWFQNRPAKPDGYDQQLIDRIAEKHQLFNFQNNDTNQPQVDNIIFILAEAFVDPNELGWETSEEILKHFNALRKQYTSGYVVVPVYGGKSINTEFELLTGLSTFFTPIESLPFRELVSDHSPSLARVLKKWGFHASVIQVVELSGFGFERIYDFLGIDSKYSLNEEGIDKDPSGRYASSQELASKIISITLQEKKSFIYAFANSSHLPWDISHYPNNTLKLLNDRGLGTKTKNKLLAYFNALRHVESLLTTLIAHYQSSDERTLIVFAGDHQPALNLVDNLKSQWPARQKYSVPSLIWSNFIAPNEAQNDFFVSMNFLASYAFRMAGIKPDGFFKFNGLMMEQIGQISDKYPFNKNLTPEEQQWLSEYEALQYKILMDSKEINFLSKNNN